MDNLRDKIAAVALDAINKVYDEKGTRAEYARAATDSFIAALPDMVALLVWDLQGDWDYKSGEYSIWLWQATDTPQPVWVLYFPDQTRATRRSLEDAIAAANAHNAAAVVAALTGAKA